VARPKLVLIAGIPGSGKTTLAALIGGIANLAMTKSDNRRYRADAFSEGGHCGPRLSTRPTRTPE
jgi:adenylate kinase family enzyme